MISLFDELSEKIARDPRLASRGGAKADLGLMLFSARDDIGALWRAASRTVSASPEGAVPELRAAVERLRPLFGER